MTDNEIDAWEELYHNVWKPHHQFVFGMNGPLGKANADALFLVWQDWFFKLHPTEEELFSATEQLACLEESFDAKWEAHHAMVRNCVLRSRAESKKNADNLAARQLFSDEADQRPLVEIMHASNSKFATAFAAKLPKVKESA